jgi:hypothetical protein
MKNVSIVFFGILFMVALAVWIIGVLTAAVVPWFGGVRADHMGAIGMSLACVGESATALGDCLFYLIDKPEKRKNQVFGLPGPKRYGNRKSAA